MHIFRNLTRSGLWIDVLNFERENVKISIRLLECMIVLAATHAVIRFLVWADLHRFRNIRVCRL